MRPQYAGADLERFFKGGNGPGRTAKQTRGRGRIDAERTTQANRIHCAARQRGVHAIDRTETAGHHKRHGRRGANVFCIFQKISFARDGALFARFGFFGMQRQIVEADEAGLLVCAAGNFEKVQAFVIEPGGDADRIHMRETAALKICGVELYRNGEVGADGLAHGAHHFEQQARAIFKAAAPLVCAVVDVGR